MVGMFEKQVIILIESKVARQISSESLSNSVMMKRRPKNSRCNCYLN